MKILTVLSVVQIAAISALFFKFIALERNMNAPTLAPSPVVVGEPIDRPHPRNGASAVPNTDPRLAPANMEQLRSVVREELAAALLVFSREQSSQRISTAPEQQTGKERQYSDYEYEREIVQNEIDYYVSRGSISEMEMNSLVAARPYAVTASIPF